MRTVTQIRVAARLAAQAYADYARYALNVNVAVRRATVLYEPGYGWRVNGVLYQMSAHELVDRFDRIQRVYHQKLRDALALTEREPLRD